MDSKMDQLISKKGMKWIIKRDKIVSKKETKYIQKGCIWIQNKG